MPKGWAPDDDLRMTHRRLTSLLLVALVAALVPLAPIETMDGPIGIRQVGALSAFPTVDGKFEGEGSIGPGEVLQMRKYSLVGFA